MAKMYFIVLDVGQGSGNFVEFYNDKDQLTGALLIDLGSEGWKKIAGGPSASFVAAELMKMVDPKNPKIKKAVLDAVFLSHSDSDHINLLIDLLDYFDNPRTLFPTKPVLTVNTVWYGGDKAKYIKGKSKKDYLKALNEYRPLNVNKSILHDFKPNSTSFASKNPSEWLPLHIIDAAKVWLLIGNTTSENVSIYSKSLTGQSSVPESYAINTQSLVLLIGYDNSQVIVTGDATGMTIAKANEILKKAGVLPYMKDVFSLTIPHHGSDTSTFDLLGISTPTKEVDMLAEDNVSGFVDSVKPKSISASAGERSTFRHPSSNVIDAFSTYVDDAFHFVDDALKKQSEDTHFYTAYFAQYSYHYKGAYVSTWPSKSGWVSVRTAKNVYSTDYYSSTLSDMVEVPPAPATYELLQKLNPFPPRGVGWAFIFAPGANPKREIVDIARRDPTQVSRLVRHEGPGGGPPPASDFVWGRSAHLASPSAEAVPPTGAVPLTSKAASGRPTRPGKVVRGLKAVP